MTLFTYGVAVGAIAGTLVGFLAAAMCAVAARADDHDTIAAHQAMRRELQRCQR
jgi:hypothetical protein